MGLRRVIAVNQRDLVAVARDQRLAVGQHRTIERDLDSRIADRIG